MDSVDYFKVESRKLRFFRITYSGAENRTHQSRRVIGDFYLPNSLDTCLSEWASANVQPCNSYNSVVMGVLSCVKFSACEVIDIQARQKFIVLLCKGDFSHFLVILGHVVFINNQFF